MIMRLFLVAAMGIVWAAGPLAHGQQAADTEQAAAPAAVSHAKAEATALDWLTKNQKADGSWGGTHSIAITSIASLAYLSADDEPFAGERGKALAKALGFLMSKQKDGMFEQNGHTWIHGQGFATLALAEAYGRTLFCKTQPDMDMKKVKETVAKAVKAIEKHQSTSGGWWYTPGTPQSHEGSTTVTAVQAMVSASNFGIEIDTDVLDKGFEYLKKCQNKDGGFDYQLGPGETSMKEGTAADVSTLALMKKFDYGVMINGYKFLLKNKPQAISRGSFPYYGHFYGCMGMKLLSEELKPLKKDTAPFIESAINDVVKWQKEDGTWPLKGWMNSHRSDGAYATAFAALILNISDARLSIFNRKPPVLPKNNEK